MSTIEPTRESSTRSSSHSTGDARADAGRPRRHRRPLRSPIAYLLIAPALAVFTVFTIVPTLFTFVLSTFHWNYLNAAQSTFIGMDNYARMADSGQNPSFLGTMAVSAYFVVAMVVLGTALSLVFALLMAQGTKLLIAARTSLFLTYVAPLVATTLIWIWIFNPRFGLANAALSVVHLGPIDWLGSSTWAMPSIIIYSLWHEVGFTTLVFIGGIATLSKDLSEAAKLDGANGWQEFWHVTFPQLRPFITFVVVIGSVASLQAFTQFFMLTGGGPGYDTSTLGYQLYQQAFVIRNTGYAAALAVVLFLLTIGLSLVQMRVSRTVGRGSDA